MLDTVVLTLARPWFEIIEPERFSPSANVLLLPHYSVRSRGWFACVLNPCPYHKSNPDILMMQSTKDGQWLDASDCMHTHASWRVFRQR